MPKSNDDDDGPEARLRSWLYVCPTGGHAFLAVRCRVDSVGRYLSRSREGCLIVGAVAGVSHISGSRRFHNEVRAA
jgi:hypothetical protein